MPSLYDGLLRWLTPRGQHEPAAPAPGPKLDAKRSAIAPLIAFQAQGQPVWTPRDFAALAREGFAMNAVVYRCVRMVSEAAASVPLLLFAERSELEQHPMLDLLRRPNPRATRVDLLETWFGHLLLAGNAYLEAAGPAGPVRELYVLRPDRMKLVPGPDGWPVAYEYTVAGRTVRFDQQGERGTPPVLHMTLFHPLNDHYGMSPLEAAAVAVDLHNAAGSWNKALLDNSARPSGALVYQSSEEPLTPEQFERLKQELETSFSGTSAAGRPLLLEGGLDWKSMGLSPKDMDFIDARNVAAREIALAFGVPPMLLGIPGDNTFSNYAEANRSFWRQTVLPLVKRTAAALSCWLGPRFGEGLELRPDLERVEALSGEREALWERVGKADFLTVNEKRAATGFAPVEGGDEPPASMGGV